MGLALGLQLLAEGGDGLVFRGYERVALRAYPLVYPLGTPRGRRGIDVDVHPPVGDLIVPEGAALDALRMAPSETPNRRAASCTVTRS